MQIALSIKKRLYRDYLKGIFELNDRGEYQLTCDHDFGKSMISRIRYDKKPVPLILDQTSVVFRVPASRPLANAKSNFISITIEDEKKLQYELEVMFNLDFDRYFIQGCKIGLMKKQIVEAFIINRKIISLVGDNETLKKREYRGAGKMMFEYQSMLLKRCNYLDAKIKKELKSFNPLLTNQLQF